ncbi:hypothetical protein Ahy_A07g034173 [Arachis hypogaea]|uniref:Aminotransferase-like plant mobile domain-containing protein n=1 Tax=Arachis hypogaea TaxID=3818 RepID=A0A445CB38_ARAHY|nr:hypothetical protein Ahy_A07g034173 [Arachis hypogaea]
MCQDSDKPPVLFPPLVVLHQKVYHAGDREYPIPKRIWLRVHIRWLPLLEDLDTCGRLSWGSTVLAWLYRHMCRATEHSQCNLDGCVSLLLSWAYHHIPLLWSDGFETR